MLLCLHARFAKDLLRALTMLTACLRAIALSCLHVWTSSASASCNPALTSGRACFPVACTSIIHNRLVRPNQDTACIPVFVQARGEGNCSKGRAGQHSSSVRMKPTSQFHSLPFPASARPRGLEQAARVHSCCCASTHGQSNCERDAWVAARSTWADVTPLGF